MQPALHKKTQMHSRQMSVVGGRVYEGGFPRKKAERTTWIRSAFFRG